MKMWNVFYMFFHNCIRIFHGIPEKKDHRLYMTDIITVTWYVVSSTSVVLKLFHE